MNGISRPQLRTIIFELREISREVDKKGVSTCKVKNTKKDISKLGTWSRWFKYKQTCTKKTLAFVDWLVVREAKKFLSEFLFD